MVSSTPPASYLVAALYRFATIGEPDALRAELVALCRPLGIHGTLILAGEGINGTVAGKPQAIRELVERLRALPGFDELEPKYSSADEPPFHRLKIRVKKEIVTLGIDGIDPPSQAGRRVAPADWNALIADPGTVVVDTRNDYEVGLGTFDGALDPATGSFRDFPAWVEANRDRLEGRRIAMFCTGGIRCEKATALMRLKGFGDVHHLEGGILKYLEEVPAEDSLWRGECFVFDERVSVGHGLEPGEASLCRASRRPLTAADRSAPEFVEGVSCPHCHGERGEADRRRYAERQRQVELARQRGAGPHIGR